MFLERTTSNEDRRNLDKFRKSNTNNDGFTNSGFNSRKLDSNNDDGFSNSGFNPGASKRFSSSQHADGSRKRFADDSYRNFGSSSGGREARGRDDYSRNAGSYRSSERTYNSRRGILFFRKILL